MSSQTPLFPPDTLCVENITYDDVFLFPNHTCPVTTDMINFLNLTTSINTYFQAYCLNPPSDDSCSFGFCPNPDIAGPLVRISAYLTNLCLSIIIFYAPKDGDMAYWSQVLTVYSLIFTSGLSIFQRSLTRVHAIIATVTAGSPLTAYLFIYSIISFWSKKHRLNGVVGEGKLIPRLLMLAAGALWGCLLIYILVPKHLSHFSQESCSSRNYVVQEFFSLPIIILKYVAKASPYFTILVLSPIMLTIIAWVVAITRQRKTIWPPGQPWRPRFGRVWSVTGRQYSFIHFVTVVLIPTVYWVSTIEVACATTSDDYFSLSFGQVLGAFVALPPIVSVLQLAPQFARWFLKLLWVRKLLGRKRRDSLLMPLASTSASNEDDASDWHDDADSIVEKEGHIVTAAKPDKALYSKLEDVQ